MYTVFLFYLYSFYLVDAKLLTSFRSSSGVCSQCCFSFLFIIWIAQSPLTFKRLLKKNYSLWVLFVIKSCQQSVNSSIRRAQVCLSHTIDPRTDTSIIQTQPGSVVSVLRGTRKKNKNTELKLFSNWDMTLVANNKRTYFDQAKLLYKIIDLCPLQLQN